MILVRLNFAEDKKEQIKKAIDTYKWKVIVSNDAFVILEITGDKPQIDLALARLEPLGVTDITRTGIVALDLKG
jgi:acetolactate synthase-1/3 small subunit